MGLTRSRFSFATSLLVCGIATQLYAAPKLRLDKTAIGPIPVALNQNGPSQTVNASNAGDAALRLTAASSATWLSATVQPLQPCGTLGNCNPITIGLNTASLAKGSYTGFVTISDPNSIDAPQTISVTVLAGGGVPDNLTFFVPANGNAVRQTFTTARQVNTAITQPTPASLSIAAPSSGSFASTITYTVSASAAAGVAPGNYSGAINVSGSTIPTENKNVPVTVTVTSQPIAALGAIAPFRIAQGAAKQTQYIVPSNPGSGTLTLSGATAAVPSGTWLTSSIVNGLAAVTADPAGLAPGSYTGTVTITSNAANNSIAVPVQLQVIPSGPPVVTAGGVLNNATYSIGDTLAQGDLPAIFGEQLIAGDVQVQGAPPWSTTLGGATVYVNDTPAPVWYVSANQINFQIPYDAATGDATVRVDRDGQRGNTVSIRIGKSAPKLLVATAQNGAVASRPFAGSTTPVTAGSYITIYALGLGQTNPPVTAGMASPSSPLAVVPGTNQVFFGNGGLFQNPVSMTPQFIGLTPGFAGLYQINVQIPDNAPRGPAVPVFLQGDIGTSNILTFNIQ